VIPRSGRSIEEVTVIQQGQVFKLRARGADGEPAVGIPLGNPESAQAAAFPVMAPLVFASSAFVPVATMPGWLQPCADHQPVSVTASAAHALTLGTPATSYVLQSLAWAAGILLVFVPIAVRRYRRAVYAKDLTGASRRARLLLPSPCGPSGS
jgi:hypothetical protein